jgi:hypothetical protein
MKGKKILEVDFGGTNIKDPDIFEWNIQSVGHSKPMTYTVDQLDDGGIYYRTDAGGKVLSNLQYIYTSGTLLILSNDMHVAKDGACQLSVAKKEGWYFARFAASMPDALQVENMQILETLKSAGVVDKDFDKFTELNNSGDRENMNMVNKILKTRYEVVVQREGVQG